MPQLQNEITAAWQNAMRSGEVRRRDTLSGLRAAIKNAEIEARGTSGAPLDETAVQAVVAREAKRRRDAIEEYERVGRPDRAELEQQELRILQEFLPAPLDQAALEQLAREAIAEAGATSPRDMAAVMKLLSPRAVGRADGKAVAATVKSLLAQ